MAIKLYRNKTINIESKKRIDLATRLCVFRPSWSFASNEEGSDEKNKYSKYEDEAFDLIMDGKPLPFELLSILMETLEERRALGEKSV